MPTYIFRILREGVSTTEEVWALDFLSAVKKIAKETPGIHIENFEGIAAPVTGTA